MKELMNINPLTNELLYKGNIVRIGGTYEQPLYVAQDICSILELKHLKLLERLPNWAKGSPLKGESLGGDQEYATLTEAGLYYLLARSNKPEAAGFQEWLFTEVIPQIRRQGFYVAKGLNPLLVQVAQGRALKAQAKQLKIEAAELEMRAASLLELEDSITVREALEEVGQQPSQIDLLKAAGKMSRIAKRAGIPVGERGHCRTYPRSDLFSALELNQAEVSYEN